MEVGPIGSLEESEKKVIISTVICFLKPEDILSSENLKYSAKADDHKFFKNYDRNSFRKSSLTLYFQKDLYIQGQTTSKDLHIHIKSYQTVQTQ